MSKDGSSLPIGVYRVTKRRPERTTEAFAIVCCHSLSSPLRPFDGLLWFGLEP